MTSPFDGSVIGTVPVADGADVSIALERADTAPDRAGYARDVLGYAEAGTDYRDVRSGSAWVGAGPTPATPPSWAMPSLHHRGGAGRPRGHLGHRGLGRDGAWHKVTPVSGATFGHAR